MMKKTCFCYCLYVWVEELWCIIINQLSKEIQFNVGNIYCIKISFNWKMYLKSLRSRTNFNILSMKFVLFFFVYDYFIRIAILLRRLNVIWSYDKCDNGMLWIKYGSFEIFCYILFFVGIFWLFIANIKDWEELL